MAERAPRRDPHGSVERDVLVRYLDAWTATVLRSQRGGTYVECGDFAADAFRVFGEFADRLEDHHLDVVVVGRAAPRPVPAGLGVRTVDALEDVEVSGPMLAHLSGVGSWPASLARGKAHEVVLTSPEPGEHRERLRAAGLGCVVAVDLVAEDGGTHVLAFATADSRHLATFKNELWAVDEFAGIRYRDPRDPEGTLVDISLTPQLLPLRRALLTEVARRGRSTVAELQRFTLLETIYRAEDTVGALTAAVAAGEVTRDPEKGRLTSRTVVSI
ncbi:hypothetical protein M8542_32275 [Amycolatopsis sp. OK19-0408]|uniref:Uncharacterized protein n=1 Tax=Amycolatopsis iheyensis TaxID=2945988 RepID=A0A9X2NF12_9PSEU|nr:hypothetical protein [Amycolatopsis iheyensis]MCR6487514.1 hypothetical protein [Amycolatopsis iheyensis]